MRFLALVSRSRVWDDIPFDLDLRGSRVLLWQIPHTPLVHDNVGLVLVLHLDLLLGA
jgi:hypothetical protein